MLSLLSELTRSSISLRFCSFLTPLRFTFTSSNAFPRNYARWEMSNSICFGIVPSNFVYFLVRASAFTIETALRTLLLSAILSSSFFKVWFSLISWVNLVMNGSTPFLYMYSWCILGTFKMKANCLKRSVFCLLSARALLRRCSRT